jgi:hypothetical protein
MGFGRKFADRFLAVPEALDLVALLVQAAASVAVGEIVGIVVLEGFWAHGSLRISLIG